MTEVESVKSAVAKLLWEYTEAEYFAFQCLKLFTWSLIGSLLEALIFPALKSGLIILLELAS